MKQTRTAKNTKLVTNTCPVALELYGVRIFTLNVDATLYGLNLQGAAREAAIEEVTSRFERLTAHT